MKKTNRFITAIILSAIIAVPLYYNQSPLQKADAFGGVTDQVTAVWQHNDLTATSDYDVWYSFLGLDGLGALTWHAIGGPFPQAGPIAVLAGDDKNPHVSTGGTTASPVTIAVWQNQDAAGSWNIKSSQFTAAGATGWTAPIDVTTTAGNEFDPNIAVDSNGAAIAVWVQDIGGARDVRFATFSGGVWSAPVVVGTLGGNPSLPEITITSVPSVAGSSLVHKAVATWADVPVAGGPHKQVYATFDGAAWTAPADIEVLIAGVGGGTIANVGFAAYSGAEPDPFGAYGRNGITADGANFAYIVWSGGPQELGLGSPGVVGAILNVGTNTVTPMLNPFGGRFVGVGGCQSPDDAIVGTSEFVNNFDFAGLGEDSRRVAGAFTLEQVSYNSPSIDRRFSNAAFSATLVIAANWHSTNPGATAAAAPGEIAWGAGTLTPPVGFDDGIAWTPAGVIVPGGIPGDDRFPELSSAFTTEVITGGLTLTPATDTNPVGATHTVTATVTLGGIPQAGVTVTFTVSGANTASGTGTSPTDAAGQASFTYTGTNAGTDTITATATVGGVNLVAEASKLWEGAPPPEIDGRMTGGGSIIVSTAGTASASSGTTMRVTHGFELHCHASDLPNNLQVNWLKNRFHVEVVTDSHCEDQPGLDEEQPVAGFDTIHGEGTGRLNGVSGATAHWTITDDGEPGTNDTFSIDIMVGTTSVLTVSGTLDRGNHQAHPAA